jgi:hydrogenase nickel incorporation protein HypA/HybF
VQSVIETMLSNAQERGLKNIRKVVLKFGTFALIQEDQFRFCFDLIKKDSHITENSELDIIWVPGQLKCQECGFEGDKNDISGKNDNIIPLFQCPACNSYSTMVLSGTEMIIDSLLV